MCSLYSFYINQLKARDILTSPGFFWETHMQSVWLKSSKNLIQFFQDLSQIFRVRCIMRLMLSALQDLGGAAVILVGGTRLYRRMSMLLRYDIFNSSQYSESVQPNLECHAQYPQALCAGYSLTCLVVAIVIWSSGHHFPFAFTPRSYIQVPLGLAKLVCSQWQLGQLCPLAARWTVFKNDTYLCVLKEVVCMLHDFAAMTS